MRLGALAVLAAAAFALLSGGIASTFRSTSAEEVQISANLLGAGSVMLTDGVCSAADTTKQPAYDATNNALDINVTPGAIANNCLGLTVTTDNANGYTLTMVGPEDGSLKLAGAAIKTKTGSLDVPTIFANSVSTAAWGFAIPKGQLQTLKREFDASYTIVARDSVANEATYAPVPMTVTPIDTVGAGVISSSTNFNYDVFFAVAAGGNMPTGAYTGAVTFSVVGNAATPVTPTILTITNEIATVPDTTMGPVMVTTDVAANCKWNKGADFTFASGGTAFTTTGGTGHTTEVTGLTAGENVIYVLCANAIVPTVVSEDVTTSVTIEAGVLYMQNVTASNCPVERTLAVDARDNATYWIKKASNLCFMMTNLAYTGDTANGGSNQFGDATTAITNGTGSSATYEARYYVPENANRTILPTEPSIGATGGLTANASTAKQYGYLYNWCAAMNGQTSACQSSTTQPDQNVNGGTSGTLYNICPKNWKLPTGNGGEMATLNTALNGGSTSSPSGLFTDGFFMSSGDWYNGSFYSQGSDGYYWSSTVSSNGTNAYYLSFGSTYVSTASNYASKQYGYAIRCVAP
jgi:uncharacterized protein (TIGR02145 family)